MQAKPRSLIVNSPYEEPSKHWVEKGGRLQLVDGRRPAGYEVFDTRSNTKRFESLDLANRIRERVGEWREASWPGVTSVTRRLLEHWHDRTARQFPLYFCQLEAIETFVWAVEAPPEFRQGIFVPGDGGPFERLCAKMATGSGKTTVMAMLITWQVLNALTYPKRRQDFSRAIFVVAPGLTVKERLQVLLPGHPQNEYDAFRLCPSEALRQRLNQAEVLIENWHSLMPLREPERSVVRKGRESDEAYTRRVLGKLAGSRDLVVLNDEAHHAYRIPEDQRGRKRSRRQIEELGLDDEAATRWIEGLDRLHRTRRIRRCFDLSATPFIPSGGTTTEANLFGWILSDFGLNDAIEAGLVKTPRVVVRDDGPVDPRTLRSKLYHLYREEEVKDDLNRKGAQPADPLPRLVRDAYTLLAADWSKSAEKWEELKHTSPPVLLTVCNRTETAARIEHFFLSGDLPFDRLRDSRRTLRVDSKVLEKAERGEKATTDKDYEARLREIVEAAGLPREQVERLEGLKQEQLLREIVDTVGKRGRAGQGLQSVVSVAMLSEGWDAKNVTHIMGLRAFTSQLLCEQVIGRGLRRVSHDLDDDGLLVPEYVNVFGVPLSVFQDVAEGEDAPPPPRHSEPIESLPDRRQFEITWPNVLRVEHVLRPELKIDWAAVEPYRIEPASVRITAELAPALGHAADFSKVRAIDLSKMPEEWRLQRTIFRAAKKAFDQARGNYRGTTAYLAYRLVDIVEQFLRSPDLLVIPSEYHRDPLRRNVLLALEIDPIVGHLLTAVREVNQERLEPIFDQEAPIRSTADMRTWYTTKPALPAVKSQLSHVVGDSGWEGQVANLLEMSPLVEAYAKNDHLDFQVHYLWEGSRRRYVPDFLIRLAGGTHLVLEVKGQDTPRERAKRAALDEWVRAVNAHGGFGTWASAMVKDPALLKDVLKGAAVSEVVGQGV